MVSAGYIWSIKFGPNEMVLLSCLGDWLQDSGWTTALSNKGATSSGKDSILSGHKVGKQNMSIK